MTNQPWMLGQTADGSLLIAEDKEDAVGEVVAVLDKGENAERNGEFIVRACNSHQTLVVALESIAKLRIIGDMDSEHVQQLVWMQNLAKAALSTVEEGASRA
jgi:hypothetical protein